PSRPHRLPDRKRFVAVRVLPTEEIGLDALVLEAVEQRRARRLPVSPGAPGLLVPGLDRAGKVPVGDQPDVGLVDAETERVRGDHRAHFSGHEPPLHLLTFGDLPLAVIPAVAVPLRAPPAL